MNKSSLKRLAACLYVAAIVVVTTGCGQKGDLYLPDEAFAPAHHETR